MAVSLVRTTLTVQAAATSGPARRLETTLGCWFTPTRVLFQQERGSIRSVSLCTKWPSDGSDKLLDVYPNAVYAVVAMACVTWTFVMAPPCGC